MMDKNHSQIFYFTTKDKTGKLLSDYEIQLNMDIIIKRFHENNPSAIIELMTYSCDEEMKNGMQMVFYHLKEDE